MLGWCGASNPDDPVFPFLKGADAIVVDYTDTDGITLDRAVFKDKSDIDAYEAGFEFKEREDRRGRDRVSACRKKVAADVSSSCIWRRF